MGRRPGRPKGSGEGLVQVGFKVDAATLRALEAFAEARDVSISAAGRLLLRSALAESGEGSLGALDIEAAERDEVRRSELSAVRRVIAKALNQHWGK